MNLKLAQISIYIPPERSFVESNCAVIYRHLLLKMFKKKCASKWMSKKNQIKSLIKKKKSQDSISWFYELIRKMIYIQYI